MHIKLLAGRWDSGVHNVSRRVARALPIKRPDIETSILNSVHHLAKIPDNENTFCCVSGFGNLTYTDITKMSWKFWKANLTVTRLHDIRDSLQVSIMNPFSEGRARQQIQKLTFVDGSPY